MKNVVIAGYARSPFTLANKGEMVKIRPDEMAAQVISGLIKNTGKTPDQTMSGTITADIKKYGTVRFITISRGVFKLNPDCYDGIDQSELKMSYNI